MMDRFAHYGWPFFDSRHPELARQAEAWSLENLGHAHGADADAVCKRLVQDLGCAAHLRHCATLAEFQMTQAKLADMATRIEAGALLTYKSAWTRDRNQRVTRDAAMAKMFATESAQQVVDDAVQICGGLGVTRGHPVERLYREVRALRIYEGATEVQKLIIARELLRP